MRVFLHRGTTVLALLALAVLAPAPARAGVTNPDISVIGQPFMRWIDDPADPSRKRVVLDPGEVEFMFDAALNPYARGTFVASLGPEEAGIAEALFIMNRGLPLGLQIKGGKYRTGFGKLNPQHCGQQHIMPRGSGNSARMAEGSPILLCMTMSGIRRSPVPCETGSPRSHFDQEGQCS